MTMENNNLENNHEGMCEVFDSHEDVVNRVRERIPEEDEFAELSEFFKIFGNPTRLKIISLLAVEDLCVCDICEALDLNQTTVSNEIETLAAKYDAAPDAAVQDELAALKAKLGQTSTSAE